MKAKKLHPHRLAAETEENRGDVSKPTAAQTRQSVGTDGLLQPSPVDPAASSAAVPAKWHWHHQVLLSLQNRLLNQHGELQRAVAVPLEPHSLDEADSATDEFDHDLALTQLSASQDALLEINEALKRIANGRYGICEETGEPIPAGRLKAVPWTRFTRQVEARLESEGVVHWVRMNKSNTVRNHGQVLFKSAAETEEEPPGPPTTSEAFPEAEPSPPRHTPTGNQKPANRKGKYT